MRKVISDSDFTLWQGDVREVLPTLAPASVDCVVTSPPYWGLRDYGTGLWDGGDPACDHRKEAVAKRGEEFRKRGEQRGYAPGSNFANYGERNATASDFDDVCGKCGATRLDRQLGLEATPDEFVANMVAVFREVRRVLAPHGTCWVNLGDSYAASPAGNFGPTMPKPGDGGTFRANKPAIDWTGAGLKAKDLCMVPARVAIALQADGWYLRSDIIWSKPNPMPESATDRPTNSHEHVFLLTKLPRYYFDQEAVREPTSPHSEFGRNTQAQKGEPTPYGDHNGRAKGLGGGSRGDPAGRNLRNVWDIATQPYPGAHFATYPEELVRRCLLAGCPEWVCRRCGRPRERIVEASGGSIGTDWNSRRDDWRNDKAHGTTANATTGDGTYKRETVGWTDCGHDDYRRGVVLDPFLGSGTTAAVARRHDRHAVGVELSDEYAKLVETRTQQLSLIAAIDG